MSERRILEEKMVALGELAVLFPGVFSLAGLPNSLKGVFNNAPKLALLAEYQRYPQDIMGATATLKQDHRQPYDTAELRFSRWWNQNK
jgi:hypothetical protein